MADRPNLLQVSMHGEVIAHPREKRRPKQIELTYTDLARERWPARTPVVSCEAEALQIALRAGLTTIDPRVLDIGGRPCLLINRYDRILDGATDPDA